MEAMLNAFKSLKPWQISVLVIVLLGALGTTYGVYALASSSGEVDLGENQQLIPVQLGDLANEVSINGSLVFPNRDILTLGTQGTIDEVLVEEGQQVQKGTLLVRLDAETTATLEKAVAQARINLRDAEDALIKAENPHKPLDMAQAEASVANAKLTLKETQDSLIKLLEPSSKDIAQAETTVVNAKLSVEGAEQALDALKNGPTNEETAKAQSAVDAANTTLANALRDLKLIQKEWDDRLQVAQESSDAALADYQAVFQKWLGITLSGDEPSLAPDILLDSWNAELSSLFDPKLQVQDVYKGIFSRGPTPDDPDTVWNETILYTWLALFPGSVVATCGDSKITPQTSCVKREMDEAWDTLQKTQDNLDTLQTQMATAVATAQSAVTRTEESLATAQETLADLIEGSDSLEIESKEKQLELDQANLDQAEADLAEFTNGPDPLEIEAKQKQVAVAQENLNVSEEDLTELLGSVDPLEVALRKAEVVSAHATLEATIQRLESATLKAPWDGIVSAINVDAGQTVNANTPVLEVVDPTVVELDGIVDEIDVLFIKEGAQATVIMDALPGQVLEGIVSDIAAEARTQQGIVSYPMSIRLQAPEGVQLVEGLSAVASVVIREERNILLVPLQALRGTFEQPVVRVMTNGRIEERVVVLGNSDDFWAVVEQGLAEGDQVVMETTQASTAGFGLGGGRGFGGGGFPGGGLRGGGGQRR